MFQLKFYRRVSLSLRPALAKPRICGAVSSKRSDDDHEFSQRQQSAVMTILIETN
ncbi:MAG: hypothetical protein FWE22_08085 [Firmicutes bacterium]|nr:hypothetical protein [Bacillota bacterium]